MYSVILLTIPILTFVLYTVSTSNIDNDEMELSGKDTVSSNLEVICNMYSVILLTIPTPTFVL